MYAWRVLHSHNPVFYPSFRSESIETVDHKLTNDDVDTRHAFICLDVVKLVVFMTCLDTITSSIFLAMYSSSFWFLPSRRGLEYADYILCRGAETPPQKRYAGCETKLPLMVMLDFLRSVECGVLRYCCYFDIYWRVSTCYGRISGLNRSDFKLFGRDRNTWYQKFKINDYY